MTARDDLLDQLLEERRQARPAAAPKAAPTRQRTKPGAFISGAALDRMQPGYERWLSFVLLAISFLGAVVTCSGGWANVLALHVTWAGVGGGVALQGVCTATQWIYHKRKFHPAYMITLSVDAVTTAMGYFDLLVRPLAAMAVIFVPLAAITLAVQGAVAVLSVLLAWAPEDRLIKD